MLTRLAHLSILCALIWVWPSFGQTTFGPEQILTTCSTCGAVDVHAADIDGDGDPDLLSASEDDNKVAWYENTDGLGSFGNQQIITTAIDLPSAVIATDLDGDGDLDLLSASRYTNKIVWFENTNGLGTFGPQKIISSSADGVRTIYAIDIDNDEDVDILSALGWYENTDGNNPVFHSALVWYENTDGLGNFGSRKVIYANNANFVDVFTGDIDGDGDIDVLSASRNDDTLAWYENSDGLGSFGMQQIISSNADDARAIYATDIDRDGDIDVISASSSDEKIAWYENTDGLGAFGPEQIISTNADGAFATFAVDFDSDGDIDVLSASFEDHTLAWYENTDGLGMFGPEQVITTNVILSQSVFAIDIDGDSDYDVLSASYFDDKIAWYENIDGQGTFGPQLSITSCQACYASAILATDLDNDSDYDILFASWADDKIAWYENTDGLGTFGSQQIISTRANGAETVFAADIDGDGDNDIISGSQHDDKIAWYENIDGQGTFGSQQIISTDADWPKYVYAIDLDGDGDQDVLSASFVDDKIAWYENTNGHGTFGPQQIISTNANAAEAVFAADIDSDGDNDVLSASNFDGKIAWYENTDGHARFSSEKLIVEGASGARSVYAAYLDGDDDIDVLSSSAINDMTAWHENTDGMGDFSSPNPISFDRGTVVFTADLDGDGDQDVLSASRYTNKIVWYENIDGQGTFGPQQIISTNADRASAVFAADLDGDGDQDVLSASSRDDKIAWYENLLFTSLPVELTHVQATHTSTTTTLTWYTASESNNAGFEVQHQPREDASFHPVAFIEGHGTTTSTQRYEHTVDNLTPGTHRFRLKQVDFDGQFS